jgi:regulator of protease activity HflC (stomatin/prohibitin superfamily)
LQTEQKGINKRLKALAEKQTREWGVNIKSIEIKHLEVVAKVAVAEIAVVEAEA